LRQALSRSWECPPWRLVLVPGRSPSPSASWGGGVAPDGLQPLTTHWAVGNANELGKYACEGTFDVDSLDFHPDTMTFTGTFGSHDPCVFTAANGDELVCYYGRTDKGADEVGTFQLTIVGTTSDGSPIVEAEFIAQFVPQSDQSTGRFAGATGGWIMYAYTDPFVLGSSAPVNYWWSGQGSLTFPR